ncbi:MAG: hypothetical protein EU539_13100 [Promethearchaeota archaeon]|nr:MAG: hypothetical protein EU539_13100 [Candidatus Lokiarchaeota archaeon]
MSDKNLQLCRFCQRNVKLAYYCEECGASCCSDCLHDERIDYFICQDCDSKNIEFFDSEGKKKCKDCESENITKVTQHLKSCPKCHSHKILNIYEKKEELEQKFLELIKETRSFIKPLRDVINELYVLRHKIKIARTPPIKCYHYPKMESELLTLFMNLKFIKDTLLEKINTHFRHLALNKEFFFDIYNQPNSNIRIIESILDNLCRSHESIEKYIHETIEEVREKIEGFNKKLKFIEKIKKLFLPYKRFLNLAEDEKPVYAIKTTLTNGLDNHKRLKKSGGILFITNYDLSFVHEYGLIKKKQELIFKAPVEDLINIKDKGKIFKKLFVQFDYGKYEFSFPSNLISKIIDYIVLARKFQEKNIFDEKSDRKLQEMDIELNDLIKYIEEGINSFFSLKCKYNKKLNVDQKKEREKDNNYNPNTQPMPYQCQNMSYYDPQRSPTLPPPNLGSNPPHYYANSNPPSNIFIPQGKNPQNYNYHWHQGNPGSVNFEQSRFYPQSIYNPYRFQNYRPDQSLNYEQYSPNQRSFPYDNNYDMDERNILMKRLESLQKNRQPVSSFMNNELFTQIPRHDTFDYPYDKHNISQTNQFFHDIQRNHLSEFFDANDPSLKNPNDMDGNIFEKNNEDHQKMMELKKEQYSLKKTLKELESKFERGVISEVDYFRTFKNLQKDIYTIEKKLKSLSDKMENDQFLRKNFTQKKYFS